MEWPTVHCDFFQFHPRILLKSFIIQCSVFLKVEIVCEQPVIKCPLLQDSNVQRKINLISYLRYVVDGLQI